MVLHTRDASIVVGYPEKESKQEGAEGPDHCLSPHCLILTVDTVKPQFSHLSNGGEAQTRLLRPNGSVNERECSRL